MSVREVWEYPTEARWIACPPGIQPSVWICFQLNCKWIMLILFFLIRGLKSSSGSVVEITGFFFFWNNCFYWTCCMPVHARHLKLSQTLSTLYGGFMISIYSQGETQKGLGNLPNFLHCSGRARASNLGLTSKLQSNTTLLGANEHSQSILGVKNAIQIIPFLLLVW